MLHKIFCIHDAKASAYLPPFFLHSEGMAARAFYDMVVDTEHAFGKHPEDYTLFYIGEYSDLTGEIESKTKKSLGNGVDFLDKQGIDIAEAIANEA